MHESVGCPVGVGVGVGDGTVPRRSDSNQIVVPSTQPAEECVKDSPVRDRKE